jgi:glucose-1-phosphate adenylyltransferase
MANSGIDNISILVRNNYHSLMDHLGSGREWDLVRKNGGLSIFPPYAEKNSKLYNGRVEAIASILDFIRYQKEKYVVISDTNVVANVDYREIIDAHIDSGADVTVVYCKEELPEGVYSNKSNDKGLYYSYHIEDGRVTKICVNPRKPGIQNFSMNMYVLSRELLIDLIDAASVRGYVYFERDVLIPQLETLNVRGYEYKGYKARISSIKTYFDENMKLLDDNNLDALFSRAPIYTKIRDDNPTRYINGAVAKNVMVADGCVIEGEIENSILFRGVKVAKGAKIKNCILMQDTVVEKDARLEHVITDKGVTISEGKELKGEDTYPSYVAKNHTV